MRSILKLAFVAALLLLPAHTFAAEHYVIDNSHTSVIFGISHLGYSYTYGRFNKVQGDYMLDRSNPAATKFRVMIDAASVDTNDAKRDDHLRGPDFFNAVQFPSISFESTRVTMQPTERGATMQVTGKLTIHGQTREVTLDNFKLLGEGMGPYENYRSGFLCQASIKRSDFGMTNMLPMIGDEVAITISFEGIRQQGEAGSGSGSAAGSGSGEAAGSSNGSDAGSGSGTADGSGSATQ